VNPDERQSMMMRPPVKLWSKLRPLAREYRVKPTQAEDELWQSLRVFRVRGFIFRRQHAIGNYIPDFSSPKAKLIIELYGSQHLEQEEYDEERTKYLESLSYKVIRFWNHDVMKDIDGVILAIIHAMEDETSKD